MKEILLVFIGNVANTESIGHFPEVPNNEQHIEAFKIFQKYSQSSIREPEKRNIIKCKEGFFYFTISHANIFYLVFAKEYSESSISTLIEMIIREDIHLLIDSSNNHLNDIGKESLSKLMYGFITEEPSKLEAITATVKETKQEMGKNIAKMVECVDELYTLEERALRIKNSARTYKKQALTLKRLTCWHNMKWVVMVAVLVGGVLLFVVLSFMYQSKPPKKI